MPLAKLFIGSALAVAFYSTATFIAVREESAAARNTWGTARDLIYLPSPNQARLMSLGYSNLVADFYWVKALQYFSDPLQSLNRYKNLADFLDIVVGVDPDYKYTYKFAGLAIPYDTGRFHYVNTRRSTGFLERGAQRFPDNWQLHFFLGYNYLNFHDEPVRAAEQFAEAARIPGSPKYLKAFAARAFAAGGEVDRAIEFSSTAAQNATDPEIKQMMESRLVELRIEKELRRIEDAAKAFRETHAHWPTLDELVAGGFERGPSGFSLDDAGVAHSVETSRRMIIKHDQTGFRGD